MTQHVRWRYYPARTHNINLIIGINTLLSTRSEDVHILDGEVPENMRDNRQSDQILVNERNSNVHLIICRLCITFKVLNDTNTEEQTELPNKALGEPQILDSSNLLLLRTLSTELKAKCHKVRIVKYWGRGTFLNTKHLCAYTMLSHQLYYIKWGGEKQWTGVALGK